MQRGVNRLQQAVVIFGVLALFPDWTERTGNSSGVLTTPAVTTVVRVHASY